MGRYPDGSVAPDITVSGAEDARIDSVVVTLGSDRLTLTVPTHED